MSAGISGGGCLQEPALSGIAQMMDFANSGFWAESVAYLEPILKKERVLIST